MIITDGRFYALCVVAVVLLVGLGLLLADHAIAVPDAIAVLTLLGGYVAGWLTEKPRSAN